MRAASPHPAAARRRPRGPAVPASLPLKRLGTSDLFVSSLGLGTMTFGEKNTYDEAARLLSVAAEGGVTLFDSAEMYPVPQREETCGRSEEYLGRWMKASRCRQRCVVATKVAGPAAMPWLRGGPLRLDGANIRAACHASLQRLGVAEVDLLQLHWPDRYVPLFGETAYDPLRDFADAEPVQAQLQALGRLVEEGKVRAVGLSNETPWGLLAFLSAASGVAGLPRVCSLQNAYSLTCRGFETSGLAEACHREGVSLLPYSPLAMGLLTGKYHAAQAQTQPGAATGTTAGRARGARDDDDGPAAEAGGGEGGGAGRDAGGRGAGEGVAVGGPPGARLNLYRDRYAEASSRYPVARPAVAAAVVAYGALARRFGLAPAALALRFAMSHPCVAAPLTGATDEAQLAQLLGAARDGPLPGELAAEVDALHAAHGDPTP